MKTPARWSIYAAAVLWELTKYDGNEWEFVRMDHFYWLSNFSFIWKGQQAQYLDMETFSYNFT